MMFCFRLSVQGEGGGGGNNFLNVSTSSSHHLVLLVNYLLPENYDNKLFSVFESALVGSSTNWRGRGNER